MCRQEVLKIKNKVKPKKKNLDFLKKFSTASVAEIQILLQIHAQDCTLLFKQKSALHWSIENKDFLVLDYVLSYFKEMGWPIDIECVVEKTGKKINCLYYALSLSKYSHAFSCFSHGINVNKQLAFLEKQSVIFDLISKVKEENPLYYSHIMAKIPSYWFNNPLSFAFWCQNKDLIKFIFNHSFSEREVWIKQLKEEICYFLEYHFLNHKLADLTVFYLADYVELVDIFYWFNEYGSKKTENISYLLKALNTYLANRFSDSLNPELNKYVLRSFLSSSYDLDKIFNGILLDNSLFVHLDYLHDLNSFYMSIKLQKELNANPSSSSSKI